MVRSSPGNRITAGTSPLEGRSAALAKRKSTQHKTPRKKKVIGPDSPDPKFRGLTPWVKGQTGNPKGSSKKARRRRLLKELIADAVNLDLPEDWRGRLNVLEYDGRLEVLIEEGSTIGEAIVVRLIASALGGDERARDTLLSSEPKKIDITLPDGAKVSVPKDPERLDAVMKILAEVREKMGDG
jgi:hypothetical protein